MANNINLLIDAYRRLNQTPANVVLAIISKLPVRPIKRRVRKMLIARDGELTGLLGGGCFEKDLMEQALSVFETGKTKAVFYDMRSPDAIVWGLGLGYIFEKFQKRQEHFRRRRAATLQNTE